jgi:hypothetical protein
VPKKRAKGLQGKQKLGMVSPQLNGGIVPDMSNENLIPSLRIE